MLLIEGIDGVVLDGKENEAMGIGGEDGLFEEGRLVRVHRDVIIKYIFCLLFNTYSGRCLASGR